MILISRDSPISTLHYLFIYFYKFILFIFGCVGSSFRARAFSSCGKRGPLFLAVWGPLFLAVRGPFTIAAPPVAGHRLQTRRLSSCGSRAQLLHGMWDLPRPGLEPLSPALAGRFSTTAPPGKPSYTLLKADADTVPSRSGSMFFALELSAVEVMLYNFQS